MNSFVKRTAVASALCAALLAPVGFSSAASAAPSSASQHATEAQFAVDAVQSFVSGERVTISGTAAAGEEIHVMNLPGGSGVETATADATGAWSLTSPGAAQGRFSVVVGDGQHSARVTLLPTHEAGDEVPIVVDPIRFTPGEKLVLTGTAAPNADLVITGVPQDAAQGTPVALVGVRAGADGRFHAGGITLSAQLERFDVTFHLGSQKVTATAVSAEAEAEVTPLTVSTTSFVTGQKQVIEGTAPAGARVDVYSGTKRLMDVTADQNGAWSYTTGSAIMTDTFSRTLKTAGQDDVTFVLTAEKVDAAGLTVSTTTFAKGTKQLVEGTAPAGARIGVHSGSKWLMDVTANAEGKWSYVTGAAITADTFTRTLKSAGVDDVTFTLTAE